MADVVVIGSGASGGTAAWNLVQAGVKVLLLDAGDEFDRRYFWTHMLPYQADARLRKGDQPPKFYLDTKEQPYLTPDGRPFNLVRVWGRGGKTNVWGRVSLRLSDLDFTAAERDGASAPWPIRYADVAPYYDKAEQLMGVCGGDDDSDALPGSKVLMPAPKPRCGEVFLKKACDKLGLPMVAGRRANFTKPHPRGFAPCHYCGNCGDGCDTASFFNAADHLIPQALETGRLEIVPNAVVARILTDDGGLASAVQYFDRRTGAERQVKARVVVLGASALDSTRILLNSRSERFPNGLGNGSDQLGRNFCEQMMVHVSGFLPQLYGRGYQNDDGIGGEHVYLPRFNHRPDRPKPDYLRGFGMQFWNTGSQTTGVDVASALPGFGASFKAEVRKRYPALVSLHPFGEVLPRPENRVTVDESRRDRYGVPLMKVDVVFGENERRMRKHMYDTAQEILGTLRAEVIPFDRAANDPPGSAIHEHGTCRMGNDPKTSVLTAFNRMHEVKNVFVVDGSAFPSASEKNPTLSIVALAWRATDYLAEELRSGRL